VQVDPALAWLLRPGHRRADVPVQPGATDTVGHVVQMLGVPLTEVGGLLLHGRPVTPSTPWTAHGAAATLQVLPRPRPQRTGGVVPARFLLDVHLGSLARRLRLVGVDTAYDTDADDEALVSRSLDEGRVLLTRDRGLLMRTRLAEGALVRGDRTQDQLLDVLGRFVPSLAPWTRCLRCNGLLQPVPMAEVVDRLRPGTRRAYRDYARCVGCGQVYWRGAHGRSLEAVVASAQEAVAAGPSALVGEAGRGEGGGWRRSPCTSAPPRPAPR
jgi:uncharacterized protein